MNVERDLRTSSSSTFTPTSRDVPVLEGRPRARPPRPLRERLDAMVARVRASVWATIVGRALAVLGALLVLAWIGRTADAARGAQHEGDAGPEPMTTTAAAEPAIAPAAPSVVAIAVAAAPPGADPPRAGGDADASAGPEADEGPQPNRGRATPNAPVYLNDADEAELRRLPGVGAKRARAILAQRARLGRFKRVEDLLRVKGVGRKAIQKWRPLVRLEPREPRDEAPAPDGGPGSGAR